MPESGWVRSAGGVVVRQQEVLLIRVSDIKGRPVWSFPKGRLDAGETPAQAAVREVMEETGWYCRIEADLSTTEYWFQREGRRFRKTVVWFKMTRRSSARECPTERSKRCSGSIAKRHCGV
jgi:diadenosine hexaphosphate hydrolase (ATP-forming)